MRLILLLLLLPCALFGQVQVGMPFGGDDAGLQAGRSVSISADGTRVAVGKRGELQSTDEEGNVTSNGDIGQVEIFDYDVVTGWTQTVVFSGTLQGQAFGESVSLSADGTRVAIGARLSDSNGDDSGSVQIFGQDTDGSWVRLGDPIDGRVAGDRSGASVSLSATGGRIAIGSPRNGTGAFVQAGLAKVYQYGEVAQSWVQVGGDIRGASSDDRAGTSVSLSADGSRVAVGAPRSNLAGGFGNVQIFESQGTNNPWTQVGQTIDGTEETDLFGFSVSLAADGSRVAIGAPYPTVNTTDNGKVEVYNFATGTPDSWTQFGSDIIGEGPGDRFGASVSLSSPSGDFLAVGGRRNDGNGTDAGHARVYESVEGAAFAQIGNDIDGEAENNQFGWSVSLSANGGFLAVGSPFDASNTPAGGNVRVFEINAQAMPIELVTFTATPSKKSTSLSWLTASEEGNEYFDLEHSANGSEWAEIGRVMSKGSSNFDQSYEFEHRQPVTGINYYRLKQTDFDGTYTRSEVITANFGQLSDQVLVYPNPSPKGLVNVSLSSTLEATSMQLISMEGRVLRTLPGNARNIDLAGFQAGTYILQIDTPAGSLHERLIVR
ncbi:T9SS type A sorting domain-containing protein [Neolewinella antarctica]|uniref:Secretion system C-terminal sorting domain-containing protein n=1 Tax=Neolewinella antarctica TaxID=442734 RepID=A0ABX0XBS0_9BACT|nr:T9SS type A sorting domain-containing protein [Neolewinella antarctica]NJC26726.1 hypothetical protein [Neolewinella antarctica]